MIQLTCVQMRPHEASQGRKRAVTRSIALELSAQAPERTRGGSTRFVGVEGVRPF